VKTRGRSRASKVASWIFGLAAVTGIALVALTVVLMASYDWRHGSEFDCGPGDIGGRTYYPCGPDQPFYGHPSGLALLQAFLTLQPEPTPQLVVPQP
jgi:hypothetical protein